MNNSKNSVKAAALAAAFFMFSPAHANASQPGHYTIEFNAQTYQANNATSIDQFDDQFTGYSPRHSQVYGLAENAMYVQAKRNGYTLQAYKRQEIFINAGRETGQLYADINARIPPSFNRAYVVDFDGYGIEHTGLSFAKALKVSSVELTPAFRVYNIDRYREIQAKGFAAARTDGSYDVNINTTERDTEADFQFPVGPGPSGLGYAVDLAAQWQPRPETLLFGSVQNLFNTNEIDNAPTTVQTINSNVNQFDSDGFLNYNPAIQGQNSRQNYTFSLPVKTHLGVQYATGLPQVHALGFDVKHISGLLMPRVSVGWQQPFTWLEGITLGYETHFEAFDIAARFKHGGVKVGFDTLSDESRRVEYLQVFLALTL